MPEYDEELYDCFKRIIETRRPLRPEPAVDGIKRFFCFSPSKKPLVAYQWTKKIQQILR